MFYASANMAIRDHVAALSDTQVSSWIDRYRLQGKVSAEMVMRWGQSVVSVSPDELIHIKRQQLELYFYEQFKGKKFFMLPFNCSTAEYVKICKTGANLELSGLQHDYYGVPADYQPQFP